jgi:adenylosuccinate synthase
LSTNSNFATTRVVLLSGPVSAGKSSLARNLQRRFNASLLKTKALITELLPKVNPDRRSLQEAGERLDRRTGGNWISTELNKVILNDQSIRLLVVDSVRIVKQVTRIRQSGWPTLHVHLTAAREVLERRYQKRGKRSAEVETYAALSRSETERNVERLAAIADVVIETNRCSVEDVYTRVASRLEVRPTTALPRVDVIVGGQYGSEGKGNIVHYLAPEYDVLVRVGGPNAGHKVFRRGQDAYTFHQLPSGALANQKAKLVIGAGAVISLPALRQEISDLAIDVDKLIVDPRAMIIEEKDKRWERKRLRDEIASTAQGVGAASARKILNRRLDSDVRLADRIPELKHYLGDTIEFFAKSLSQGQRIMLEGTQGTGLGIHHGFYPHVTSRVTAATGCLAEAGISARHVRRVVLVCRTYPIRVGNTRTRKTSGFMSMPIPLRVIAERSKIPLKELRRTERTSTTKRARRIAEFDWAQLRRSLVLNGPTDIALTFADYLGIENRRAFRFEQLNEETLRFIEEIEKVSSVPVSLISTKFDERNVIDRRTW